MEIKYQRTLGLGSMSQNFLYPISQFDSESDVEMRNINGLLKSKIMISIFAQTEQLIPVLKEVFKHGSCQSKEKRWRL